MHPMYHPAFVQFLSYFNGNRDFFECHEVLEDYWKDIAPRDKNHPLTGWIQLATGMYHWRRGNYRGASTILKKSWRTLQASIDSPFLEKVDHDSLLKQLTEACLAVEQQEEFQEFKLIISDNELQMTVNHMIDNLPTVDIHYIMNKHLLRDRTQVIKERQAALIKRQLDTKRSRH